MLIYLDIIRTLLLFTHLNMDAEMFETPEGDIEQKNKSIQFLRKLQLGDLCFRDLMMYGLVMLGKTKAGKTTLAHHLIKNPLKGSSDENYQLNGGTKFVEAIIGHSNVSQTQIPNQITTKLSQHKPAGEHKNISPEKSLNQSARNSSKQEKLIKKQSDNVKVEIHIIDCPGYSDSKGCHMQIANGYFHYRVFSKLKNIKFVLVMDYGFFTGKAQKPADTIIQFLMSFKNLHQIKNQIIGATSFVFTKLKKYNKQTDDQIREYIKNKLTLLKESSVIQNIIQYKDVIEELIDAIIEKKRYYFFEKAEANVLAPANDLLAEICRNTTYWSRDFFQDINEVDMGHIQMTLGRKCFDEASKNKQFSEDYKNLMNEFNERFSTAIAYTYKKTNLAKITEIFLLNSLYAKGTNKQYNKYVEKYHPELYLQRDNEKDYYALIQQFNKFFNIYGKDQKEVKAKEYAKKRGQLKALLTKCSHPIIDKSQVSQIQKLEIAKMIMDVVSIKQEILVNDRSLARLRSISNKILLILAQLKKIKIEGFTKDQQAKYIQTIQQFYYIIFRLLQEARVFKILFTFQVSANQKQQLDQVLLKNVDSIQILFDYSQALTNQKYYNVGLGKEGSIERIKAYYFAELYEAKPDQTSTYYLEIDNYFDDMVVTNKLMIRQAQKKRILLRKNNIDKNAKEFQKRKDYKLLELVKNIKSAAKIAMMQGQYSSQNTENIQLITNQLNELGYQLSKIEQKISEKIEDVRIYLKAAIQAFKSTKNVYKCIESYKQLIHRFDDKADANNLLVILDEYAQYCSKNGRIQLSIEIYQHAFSIVQFMTIQNGNNLVKQKMQKRKEICKKIGMIGISKKYGPSDAYYEQMMRYTIYDEIDFAVFDRIQKLLSTVQ